MGGARGWKRLATVYGLVEQMRSVELRAAAGAVEAVEAALRLEAAKLTGQGARGGKAFADGDGVDWAVGETTREYAVARMERLREMKAEREEVLDAAMAAHRASRVQVEQIESVLERAARTAAEEETRRAQAVADDRYAGQQWLKARGFGEG